MKQLEESLRRKQEELEKAQKKIEHLEKENEKLKKELCHIRQMGLLDPIFSKRLDQKLDAVKKRRPIPAAVVAKLKEQFAIELTYNSNAIEGNRLTLKETYLLSAL